MGKDYFKVRYMKDNFESELKVPLANLSEGKGVKLKGLSVILYFHRINRGNGELIPSEVYDGASGTPPYIQK